MRSLSPLPLLLLASLGLLGRPVLAFGPVRLHFGPASLAVSGWDSAWATISGTPFLMINSLLPPLYGIWGGDYASATQTQREATALGAFSTLAAETSLCLTSVPIGSYSLQVNVGDSAGPTSSCLDLLSGEKIYEGTTTSGAFASGTAIVHKQTVEECLRIRACQGGSVINTWEVDHIVCHLVRPTTTTITSITCLSCHWTRPSCLDLLQVFFICCCWYCCCEHVIQITDHSKQR
ncbi:unnamed protein product [Polarella glacialis]|uniref:Uncharacterized protein n=1 Tax=Polarella glacialis TaxID=89957 RepID=A0A813JZG9_POLGL|nr:unnamed protein product [Polarella glacialis]CAE8688554.1 unnamed protein product [Polarella glacialis]